MKLKKLLTGILAAIMVITIAIAAIGCGDKEVTVESIELNKTTAEFFAGESLKLDDYEITIKYSDGKTEKVALKEAMLNADDLSKLSNAGTYDVTVSASGKTVTLKVTVKNLDLTDAAIADKSVAYTGEAIYPDVTGIPESATVLWTIYEGEDATGKKVEEAVDAGTYFAEAKISLKNHNDLTLSAKIVIAKQKVDPSKLEWSNLVKFYEGEEISLDATVKGLPEGIEIDSFEGETTANKKGKYTATVKFKGENKNYIIEDYSLSWEVVADVTLDKWFTANNGALKSATFTKDANDGFKGTFAFDGESVKYDIVYDIEGGKASFTLESGSGISEIAVSGDILTVVKAEETFKFITKGDIETYFDDTYSLLTEELSLVFDEANGKAVLSVKANGKSTEKPVSIQFADNATSATDAKFVAADGVYAEYSSSYKNLRIYKYKLASNLGLIGDSSYDEYYDLAKKADVDELKGKLFSGEFVDKDGNVLKIDKDKLTASYNGVNAGMYAVLYSGKATLKITLDTENKGKDLTAENGFYKFAGTSYSASVYFPKEYLNYTGIYYLVGESGLVTTEKFSFNEYSSYFDVRSNFIPDGKTSSESKTFDFGVTGKNALKLEKDGTKLVAKLVLADGNEYAAITFNQDGTATANGKTFKKVEKLINKKSSWGSGGQYYAADGSALAYSLPYGKAGTFTFGGKDYTAYVLSYEGNKLTIVISDGENSHTIVSEDKRYVTVDGTIYLADDVYNLENGFKFDQEFVRGESKVKLAASGVLVDGVKLTNAQFSFVDDGNNNGRTVLKTTGNKDGVTCNVVFYSRLSVKVNDLAYVPSIYSTIVGIDYKPSVTSEDTFTITVDGKFMFNGVEYIPSTVNDRYSDIRFVVKVNGYNHVYKLYTYKNNLQANFIYNGAEKLDVDYYPIAYYIYKGLYRNGDKVFYFDGDLVCYDNGSKNDEYTFKSMDATSATINVASGKEATFVQKDGKVTVTYQGEVYEKVLNFDLADYFGNYSVLTSSGYVDIAFNAFDGKDVSLSGMTVYDGKVAVKTSFNSYQTAYLLTNTDAATAGSLPYIAIEEKVLNVVGSGKVNGKDFTVSINVGNKPDSNEKAAVLKATYGNDVIDVNVVANKWVAVLDGVEYYVEAINNEYADLLIYQAWTYRYTGRNYVLNGKTVTMEAVVNEDGESVIVVKFNGEVVEAAFEDLGSTAKMMTFTYNNVNYKTLLSENYDTLIGMRVFTENEYEFFYNGEYDENDDAYTVKIDGKDFRFKFEIGREFVSNYDYAVIIDAENSSYDGKTLKFAQYVYEASTLVFVTEDGSFAYNVEDKTVSKDVLPENEEIAGLKLNGAEKSEVKDVTLIVKYDGFKDGKATVKAYFDFSSSYDGELNVATVEKINGGYKLTGVIEKNKTVTAYLLKESDGFALYSEAQYALAGEYTVGDKTFVISGTHENGAFSYKISYNGAEAVAFVPDFAKKSFEIASGDDKVIFSFEIKDGKAEFKVDVVPAAAMKFVSTGMYFYNMDSSWSNQHFEVTITFKSVENGKAKYDIVYNDWYKSEGTLSDDGTYVASTFKYPFNAAVRVYLNPVSDEYYKYVVIKESDSVTKLIGTFKDGEGNTLIETKLVATSTDDDGEPDYSERYISVSYNGKTAKASFSASASEITFKIDGKTYVAKLDTTGKMTVAEKA